MTGLNLISHLEATADEAVKNHGYGSPITEAAFDALQMRRALRNQSRRSVFDDSDAIVFSAAH